MLLLSNDFFKGFEFVLKMKISRHRINKFRLCNYDHLKYERIMCLNQRNNIYSQYKQPVLVSLSYLRYCHIS